MWFVQLSTLQTRLSQSVTRETESADALAVAKQTVQKLQAEIVSAQAETASQQSANARLSAQVTSLKDQVVTLGDHATSLAKARTEALFEVKQVRLELSERQRAFDAAQLQHSRVTEAWAAREALLEARCASFAQELAECSDVMAVVARERDLAQEAAQLADAQLAVKSAQLSSAEDGIHLAEKSLHDTNARLLKKKVPLSTCVHTLFSCLYR